MKRKIFTMIIFLNMVLSINSVHATDVCINSENEEINAGRTVKVKLDVKNIDIDQGINAIQGTLQYDKDIFEKVETTDFTSINNWVMAYNDENTESEGKFILMKLSSSVKDDEDIIEIQFKVKENIKSTKTDIKLQNLHIADDENVIQLEDSKVSLKVKGKFSIKNMFLGWFDSIFNRN